MSSGTDNAGESYSIGDPEEMKRYLRDSLALEEQALVEIIAEEARLKILRTKTCARIRGLKRGLGIAKCLCFNAGVTRQAHPDCAVHNTWSENGEDPGRGFV